MAGVRRRSRMDDGRERDEPDRNGRERDEPDGNGREWDEPNERDSTGGTPAPDSVAPGAPRETQTLRLPESRLASLRAWAESGTALAVGARVRGPDGRVALVRNEWTEGWFVPGGAVEPGEHPRRAARREVREETGLSASVGKPLLVVDQTYADPDGDPQFEAAFVVYAARADGEIPDADRLGVSPDEIEAARWFDDAPERLHDEAYLRPLLRDDPE